MAQATLDVTPDSRHVVFFGYQSSLPFDEFAEYLANEGFVVVYFVLEGAQNQWDFTKVPIVAPEDFIVHLFSSDSFHAIPTLHLSAFPEYTYSALSSSLPGVVYVLYCRTCVIRPTICSSHVCRTTY